MAHILITSGPTRAYLDDVRFLSNGSSGRMGAALAAAAIAAGHRVSVVSGPVSVPYPARARVISVTTTREMLDACLAVLPDVDGVIAAAAPCDFEPAARQAGKIARQGRGLTLRLVPTVDIVATLVEQVRERADLCRWFVAFALEVGADHARAIAKLRRKQCDLIVVNDLPAVDATRTAVCVLDHQGEVAAATGTKGAVARRLLKTIEKRLINPRGRQGGRERRPPTITQPRGRAS
jgi:phosphopantothenoylcysteine decarboxylase/phosphopantothenate--cysteine ligase